jgi:putative IMPACT (imprinted ancient) family translation regulator
VVVIFTASDSHRNPGTQPRQALTLLPNRTGTSESDYILTEASEDDGERWAGERLIKVLREEGATDVLVVCSRWFGGTLLGVSWTSLRQMQPETGR